MIKYTKFERPKDGNVDIYPWGNIHFEMSFEELEEYFGPYHFDMSRDETGLFDARCWLMQFNCGLLAGISLNTDINVVTVHLDVHEIQHFLLHTGLEHIIYEEGLMNVLNKTTGKHEDVHPPRPKDLFYSLHRQDDNGNCFCMFEDLTKRSVECMKDIYDERQHKQYYEIKKHV